MNLIIEYGDLFELDREYPLAHCISSDFALGKGVALEFNKRYKMGSKLRNNYTINGKVPNCIRVDNVYNLITKPLYWHKPTYKTLEGSLRLMKAQMIEKGENKVAMPMIGCGLDKLQWGAVIEIIRDVFLDTDIEVRVRLKKK